MNIEHRIEYQEDNASKKIFPEIKEHIEYLDKVYNFCFTLQHFLDKKTIHQVGMLLRCQMMILMRITDFLRCIRHEIVLGYPEQAGTLASSIYELAHTAVYFSYDIKAMEKWLNSNDDEKYMPKLISVNSFKKLVEHNYSKLNIDPKIENLVYRQLCWMKHSHPIMQDILIENSSAKFLIGPHTDERSISHAWFVIEHSGRLTEMLICHIMFPEDLLSDSELDIKNKTLNLIFSIRKKLNQKACKRFENLKPKRTIQNET